MRGDAVFYLFIFLCATFYYYGASLLSAFNAWQRVGLPLSIALPFSHCLPLSLVICKVGSVGRLAG